MKRIVAAILFLIMTISGLNAQDKTQSVSTAEPYLLPPFPVIPAKQPIDSIPMGNWETFPEITLDIPIASGPYAPTWESIEQNYPGEPAWLREAKFGIWVHFGPQSAGESGDWYARNLYKPGTRAYKNHLRKYGHPSEVGYKEVLHEWNPTKLNPAKLTKIYEDAGARFLMIQGVHHDNYDMWNSRYQPWNSVNIGPKRDLLGEWAKACRANKMHFGVTFHHEYTWWWWQTAFGSDTTGNKKGVPYDGNLTLGDGKGKWWEGYDPRLLYGIDLREYKGVAQKAQTGWSPAPAGIFTRHLEYAKWYATQWALRMMDVVEHYDPDFIYTDGTVQGPFTGNGTGTGLKANAMQTVIADFYNRTLQRRGQVNTFSIVKFRKKTNGTVNTEEFGVPADIKTDQPWIAEAPVGDWFYAPDFTYDSGMMIRYVIEAVARDGNAALCISILPDGSLDDGSLKMLKEVGVWMRRNGEAVYGSRAWIIPGEGEQVNGKLKMLPGGALNRKHAEFKFNAQDFRFTMGKNGALYAFCMVVPSAGTTLKIKAFGTDYRNLNQPIRTVTLLGYHGEIHWKQEPDGLSIFCPKELPFATSIVFKIE
jgi:alpha-L-fucosidase